MPFIFKKDNRVQESYGRYGYTRNKGKTFHAGIDIDTLGDPTIHSTVSGKVKYARLVKKNTAGWGSTWQWGYFVWIVANDSTNHIFAHCKRDSLLVKEGQRVVVGQAIATMGMTGNASQDYEYGTIPADPQAEHVHYEVRNASNKAVDPTPWCSIPNAVGTTMNPNSGGSSGGTGGTTELNIGDVVTFTGNKHYVSSAANAKSYSVKPGKAKVTNKAIGTAHEYHLENIAGGGSTVYGWVNASDIPELSNKPITTPPVSNDDIVKTQGIYLEVNKVNGVDKCQAFNTRDVNDVVTFNGSQYLPVGKYEVTEKSTREDASGFLWCKFKYTDGKEYWAVYNINDSKVKNRVTLF